MADKMMRVAGRTKQGLAKPFLTDENGRLDVDTKATYTYGWGNGMSTKRGFTDDWLFATGEDETSLQNGDYFINNTVIKKHIVNDDGFIEGRKFIAIPIAADGWRIFKVSLNNGWGTTIDVSAYRVPSVVDNANFPSLSLFRSVIFENETLTNNSTLEFHTGGLSLEDVTQLPTGYLLIEINYHSKPTGSALRIGVERQK